MSDSPSDPYGPTPRVPPGPPAPAVPSASPEPPAPDEPRSAIGTKLLVLAASVALAAVIIPWGEDGLDVLSIFGGSGGDEAGQAAGGRPAYRFPVTVAEARPGRVIETVELVGDVVSSRWAVLAFERSGRIAEVYADLGDAVSTGTPLARLDDKVLDRQLDVARAAARGAAALAENARREAERGNDVGDDLSASERDRRNAAAIVAEHRSNQAAAEIGRLQALLEQGVLSAPFEGVITQRAMTDGSYAAAGAPAFAVADLDRREVRLEVPAALATGLRIGAPVTLSLDIDEGVQLDARLDRLVPAADFDSRTFEAIVDLEALDPERRMLPGLFVRARFVRRSVDADCVVPADAVQGPPDAPWIVLAAADDAQDAVEGAAPLARFVPVRVLARNATQAAVEPLNAGDLPPGCTVLVTGADNVFPQAPLRPVPHAQIAGSGAETP